MPRGHLDGEWPQIDWPESWDPREGWPIECNPRKSKGFRSLCGRLRRMGISLHQVCLGLGKQVYTSPVSDLTEDLVKEAILQHFEDTGKWPTATCPGVVQGATWSQVYYWLYRRDSSLHILCVSLGKQVNVALGYIRQALVRHYRRYGKWPTKRDHCLDFGKSWRRLDYWLQIHGTNLASMIRGERAPIGARRTPRLARRPEAPGGSPAPRCRPPLARGCSGTP